MAVRGLQPAMEVEEVELGDDVTARRKPSRDEVTWPGKYASRAAAAAALPRSRLLTPSSSLLSMDIPLFGDAPNKRRREINLGGTHTATSHNDILQEAKLRRSQRNDLKRRQDSALLIQHWWRGRIALNDVRQDLRHTFDQDVTSITGLRCLVLLGQDEDALGRWSTVVLSSRKGARD